MIPLSNDKPGGVGLFLPCTGGDGGTCCINSKQKNIILINIFV